MDSESFLGIDLGAESGRGVVGTFDGQSVELTEIGRFPTGRGDLDMCEDGVQRWDIDRIYAEIRTLISRAMGQTGGRLAGIGVDGWGVDFGLFDAWGKLLARPVCYRDRAHVAARDSVLSRMSESAIWDETGIQGLSFNSLYQIEAVKLRSPELLDRAARLQLLPDVIHNLLTRGAYHGAECTDASTTQMMLPGKSAWNFGLLERLGLPSHFLGPLVEAGSRIGTTEEGVAVYAPATHDTASAVVAAPVARCPEESDGWVFLSSGTWSLLGSELTEPLLSHEAMRLGFSNERGVGGTTRFLKNIMGLWLVQQSRRSICAAAGRDYSYAELAELATEAPPGSLIDAADERFLNPPNMVDEIRRACLENGQPEPAAPGEIVRCCLESLAFAYRRALRDLSALRGCEVTALHIVGGGSQNTLLNQWTADACGIPVYAGPSEATALGNVLAQMKGAGMVSTWNEARELSRRSFAPQVYQPARAALDMWAEREAKVEIRQS